MAENLPQANFGKSSRALTLAFFFFGLFLLALGGGLFLFKGSTSNDDIQIISSHSNDSANQSEIVVHVDGAVVAPGVYKLPVDSRVSDAVVVAGGLASEADSAKINLAARLSDGQKIYVFAVGENTSITSGQSITGTTGSITSLVNINTASEAELDKLPGVGPVTAAKIISSRPYSALEDLLTKKAVNKSTYEKIKDLITVY